MKNLTSDTSLNSIYFTEKQSRAPPPFILYTPWVKLLKSAPPPCFFIHHRHVNRLYACEQRFHTAFKSIHMWNWVIFFLSKPFEILNLFCFIMDNVSDRTLICTCKKILRFFATYLFGYSIWSVFFYINYIIYF